MQVPQPALDFAVRIFGALTAARAGYGLGQHPAPVFVAIESTLLALGLLMVAAPDVRAFLRRRRARRAASQEAA